MKRLSSFFGALFFFFPTVLLAQDFTLKVEPMTISTMPGIQSYAWAKYEGKWVLLGGRTDGLHKRQANASFDQAGQNSFITVVDPVTEQVWTSSISSLPTPIQEQFLSTNMEFIQADSFLYVLGGYGYSVSKGTHITHPVMSAIHLPSLLNHVLNGQSIQNDIRQISDTNFAVTGGYLNELNGVYHLTGGHRFDGRYNPMGHASYTQTYTNADRKFTISDDGVNLNVTFLAEDFDPTVFHRRDYNVVPQIFPNGGEGLIAFSGVFQIQADLPFLNAVLIDSQSYHLEATFSQYYQQYHCAHIPLYSENNKAMHTLFLGGISQYYDSAGTLVRDDNVPFVKGISRVTLDQTGTLKEYNMGISLPDYLGASAEFIPADNLPEFHNGVLKYDDMTSDTTLIGYMVGGIQSTAKNIFFINTGSESSASPTIYKITLIKGVKTGMEQLNGQSYESFGLQVVPNPAKETLELHFNAISTEPVVAEVFDMQGKLLYARTLTNLSPGEQTYRIHSAELHGNAMVIVMLHSSNMKSTQKVVLTR